jgi:hypothetical protein
MTSAAYLVIAAAVILAHLVALLLAEGREVRRQDREERQR